jgi:hypothetical protein
MNKRDCALYLYDVSNGIICRGEAVAVHSHRRTALRPDGVQLIQHIEEGDGESGQVHDDAETRNRRLARAEKRKVGQNLSDEVTGIEI